MSIICNKCSNLLPQNAKFCGICGSQVIALKYCSCGNTVKPNAKFCGNCGKSFTNQEDNPTNKISICNCGASLKANMKFCGSCGMSVVNTQQTPPKADSQNPSEQKLEQPIEEAQLTKENETSESKAEQNDGNNICGCGAVVLANAKFCNSCGAVISKTKEVTDKPDEKFTVSPNSAEESEQKQEKANEIGENTVDKNNKSIENEIIPKQKKEVVCSCGEIVLEDEKFCAYCGSSVVSKDDVNKKQSDTSSVSSSPTGESKSTQKSNSLLCLCGATLKNSQKFCFNCGAKNNSKDTSVAYQANSNSNQCNQQINPYQNNQNQHFNNSGNLSHKKKKRKKTALFVFIGLFMMFSIAALSVIFIFDFGFLNILNRTSRDKLPLPDVIAPMSDFRLVGIISPELAFDQFSDKKTNKKLHQLGEILAGDLDSNHAWQYFFSNSLVAITSLSPKQVLTMYYCPYIDVALFCEWTGPPHYPTIINAELLSGYIVRNNEIHSDPLWRRINDLPPQLSLMVATNKTINSFIDHFGQSPQNETLFWQDLLPKMKSKDEINFNYNQVGKSYYESMSAINLYFTDSYFEPERNLMEKIHQYLVENNPNKVIALANDNTIESDQFLTEEKLNWSEVSLVSVSVAGNNTFIFLGHHDSPELFICFWFEKSSVENIAKLRRVDFLNHSTTTKDIAKLIDEVDIMID